ncbi:SDR family NAD(P)-dependent oxidoreductase, partial [Streptomyces luteogriseus]
GGAPGHYVVPDAAHRHPARRLAEEVGEVDVLVNNAGIFPFSTTPEQPLDSYDRVFDVNVRATYFLTAALVPAMVAKGKGAIVNVSSVAGQIGTPFGSAYNATKAAMDALTRSWAVEFGAAGVRVNSVAPGPIRTDMAVETVGEMFDEFSRNTPLARAGEPEEIAEAVAFLASDKAGYITGAVLAADGGYVAT